MRYKIKAASFTVGNDVQSLPIPDAICVDVRPVVPCESGCLHVSTNS